MPYRSGSQPRSPHCSGPGNLCTRTRCADTPTHAKPSNSCSDSASAIPSSKPALTFCQLTCTTPLNRAVSTGRTTNTRGQNGAVRDGRTRLAPLAPTRGGERVAGAAVLSRSWSFWASSSWFYFVRRVSKHSAGVADNCAGGTFCLPVRAGASSVLRSCASALAPRLSSQGEVERVDVLEVLSWQSDHSFNANRRWGSQESRAGPGPAFAQARSPTRPHGLKGDPRCLPRYPPGGIAKNLAKITSLILQVATRQGRDELAINRIFPSRPKLGEPYEAEATMGSTSSHCAQIMIFQPEPSPV